MGWFSKKEKPYSYSTEIQDCIGFTREKTITVNATSEKEAQRKAQELANDMQRKQNNRKAGINNIERAIKLGGSFWW